MSRTLRTAVLVCSALSFGACAELFGLDAPLRNGVMADAGNGDAIANSDSEVAKVRIPCAELDATEEVACALQGCSASRLRTCLRDGYTDYGACACSGWRAIEPPPPSYRGRHQAVAVWTGEEVLVWGGFGADKQANADILADGAAYAPGTNTWRILKTSPLTPRLHSAAAWTGTELIIWGGVSSLGTRKLASDGAAYNPISDTWRRLPQSPLAERSHAFSALDVASNSVVIWGGEFERGSYARDGALYRIETGRFEPTEPPPASFAGRTPLAALAGGTLFVLGGACTTPCTDFLSYSPAAKLWRKPAMPPAAFAARQDMQAVACGPHGQDAYFWGGTADGEPRMDGMRFGAGAWSAIAAPTPAILPNASYTLFCVAEKLGVLAGLDAQFQYRTDYGALFTNDAWSTLPPGAPANRTSPIVIPMGRELFVWGGFDLARSNGIDYYPRDGKILRLPSR